MTVYGQQVDVELVKTWALQLQRVAMIVGLIAFLFGHPEHTTAWAMLGAVTADLFHAAKSNGNGNGNGKPTS